MPAAPQGMDILRRKCHVGKVRKLKTRSPVTEAPRISLHALVTLCRANVWRAKLGNRINVGKKNDEMFRSVLRRNTRSGWLRRHKHGSTRRSGERGGRIQDAAGWHFYG